MAKLHAKRKQASEPLSWLRIFIFIMLPLIGLISMISGSIFIKAYHQHPTQYPRMQNIHLVLTAWVAERKKHITSFQEKKAANRNTVTDQVTGGSEVQDTTPQFEFYNTLPNTAYSAPPISAPVIGEQPSEQPNKKVVAQDELKRAFSNELANEKLNVKRKRKSHD